MSEVQVAVIVVVVVAVVGCMVEPSLGGGSLGIGGSGLVSGGSGTTYELSG